MKYHSKQVAVALALATLLSPTITLAHEHDPLAQYGRTPQQRAADSGETKKPKDAQICLRLEKGAEGVQTRLTKTRGQWQQRKSDRRGEFGERKDAVDAKLETFRASANDARENIIEKLLAKYPDAEDQAAINAFKSAIDAAVAKRRSAIDAAITAYRTGVSTALEGRQAKMETAIATMDAAIKAAMDKAKEDCANGVEPATVRTNLQAAIKAAREKFKTDAQNAGSVESQLKTVKQTRDAAIKKAVETFKTEAAAARDTLKAALGKEKPTENDEQE